MKTLNEMAQDLQDYILSSQQDAHNSSGFNAYRYNNLKLRMETRIPFPNLVIRIGISEVMYNLKDQSKADGSLGPDERYVKKWICMQVNLTELRRIDIAIRNMVKEQYEIRAITLEGEAKEVKKEAPQKAKFKQLLDESRAKKSNKKDLKDYLKKSMRKKGDK